MDKRINIHEMSIPERIEYLASFIESLPHTETDEEGNAMGPLPAFNMSTWDSLISKCSDKKSDCGTICCIGGWMHRLFFNGAFIFDDAMGAAIGLNKQQTQDLFYPDVQPDVNGMKTEGWNSITPAMAAETLRGIIKTGKVVWKMPDGTIIDHSEDDLTY